MYGKPWQWVNAVYFRRLIVAFGSVQTAGLLPEAIQFDEFFDRHGSHSSILPPGHILAPAHPRTR